jgi:hypothetical protein
MAPLFEPPSDHESVPDLQLELVVIDLCVKDLLVLLIPNQYFMRHGSVLAQPIAGD